MPPKKKIVAKKTVPVKKPVKRATAPVTSVESASKIPHGKYVEAVGRRKTSVARVRIFENSSFVVTINDKKPEVYFPTYELQNIIDAPFSSTNLPRKFLVSIKVNGGGIHSQAEAVRHGISRVIEKMEPALRKTLKPLGFLKRDPRAKERRKFGLKKARKAPQWAKR